MSKVWVAGILIWLAAAATGHAERFALVVGVNDCPGYRVEDRAKPRALRGAETDAAEFARVLKELFRFESKNVCQLTGPQASYEGVKTAFENLSRQMRPGDSFVLYFAGHGTQIADRKPRDEDDDLDEALCLFDATSSGENLLIDDELALWLEDLPAHNITVVMDCCHAGTTTKDLEDDETVSRGLPMAERKNGPQVCGQYWQELEDSTKSPERRLVALFACGSNQQAYERRVDPKGARSYSGQFTMYLLQGLRDLRADADHNGSVSSKEAISFALGRLEPFNSTRRESSSKQQPWWQANPEEQPLLGIPVGKD